MTLLLACLLFVAIYVPASHAGALPPTYDGSMCSKSSRCGSVEIKYPFYFADATRATTDDTTTYSCGYTDLKVVCKDNGLPFLQLSQDSYMVKDINYTTSTILLADADAFRSGNDSCRVVLHNVTFGPDWLRYNDSSYDYLSLFLGCYSGETLPTELHEYQIDCPGFRNPSGGGASLVFSSYQNEVSREHDLNEHCNQLIVVPFVASSLYGLSDLSMLPREYGGVLRQGFQLEWNPIMTDHCQPCEQSGARCSYSQNKDFLGCLCAQEIYCINSQAITISSPSTSLGALTWMWRDAASPGRRPLPAPTGTARATQRRSTWTAAR